MKKNKMIITDLDGTLFTHNEIISLKNIETLKYLESNKILRVIATGRSLYSALNVLDDDFPIDILVFSSGAGIYDFTKKELIFEKTLVPDEVKKISDYLNGKDIDFMIHHSIPDNHRFDYFRLPKENTDFIARKDLYESNAFLSDYSSYVFTDAAQVLAIIPFISEAHTQEMYSLIKNDLPDFSVIRTTSPLNHKDIWIEIFPKEISKAFGLRYLMNKYNLSKENIACIGNDFNDLDMLENSLHSYVVNNAPNELKKRFNVVASCDESGFSEAVFHYLKNRTG